MAASEDLFLLVQSLTSNEKRHFQLQASLQTGKKTYLRLFEILDQLEIYDQRYVSKKFEIEKIAKNLPTTESYLYLKIMDSLRNFHEGHSINKKIHNLLLEAEILKKKGFYRLSLKALNKAEKVARQHHKHFILLSILPQKANTILAQNQKQLAEEIHQSYKELDAALDLITEEIDYRYRNIQFVLSFRKGAAAKTATAVNELEAIYTKTIEQGFPKEGSFYAQYYFYGIQAKHAYIQKNYPLANLQQANVVEIWDQHPVIKKNNLQLYITQLANQINYSNLCKQYDKSLELIDKMAHLKAVTFDEQGEQFQNVYFYKQYLYLNQEDFETSKKLIPEIELGLKKYKQKVNTARKLNFYYNSTITFFLTEDYQNAANWLDKILSITRTNEHRKDIQRFARILQLVIYYKLSTHEVLEYMFRSVNRNTELKNQMIDFEKVILKHFKLLLTTIPQSKNERTIFLKLKTELEQLDASNKRTLGFEELYMWVNMMCKKN